ncbi:DUF3093 domain-containing protein [Rhodoluna sp.]|uniref:DUF3093 domain-containing protein n=1 Tax=Rhodoluna sp. TaxID=1969481 RepID=UPI0025D8053D|nr:DUF3093 domain-containing protein [Rhodoluna sp.]
MSPETKSTTYHERVLPSFASFLPLLLLPPTGWLTLAMINQTLGLVIGSLLAIGAGTAMVVNSPVIDLDAQQLRVGKAHIPLKQLGKAEFIAKREAFAERGPKLDIRAFIRFQMGVSTMVKVAVKDKNDPTPYWLFSSHQAEYVAALLNKRAK